MLRGRKAGTLRLAPVKHFRCVYSIHVCFMLWHVVAVCGWHVMVVVNVTIVFAVLVLLIVVSSLFPDLLFFFFLLSPFFFYLILLLLSFFLLLEVALVVELVGFAFLIVVGLCHLALVISLILTLVTSSVLLVCYPGGLAVLHYLAPALSCPTISRPDVLPVATI